MRRTDGRTFVSGCAVLLAGCAVLLAGPLATPAAARAVEVDRHAWVRSGDDPTLVPAEDRLYVGVAFGEESARTFLHVNLGGLSSRARLEVTFEEAADSVLGEDARLSACPLKESFATSGEIEPDVAPEVDCSRRVDGERDDEGRWSFDVSSFVERWIEKGNHGLSVLPDLGMAGDALPGGVDPPDHYRIAIDPETAAADLSGEPRPVPPRPPPPDPTPQETPEAVETPVTPPRAVQPVPFTPPSAGASFGAPAPDVVEPEPPESALAPPAPAIQTAGTFVPGVDTPRALALIVPIVVLAGVMMAIAASRRGHFERFQVRRGGESRRRIGVAPVLGALLLLLAPPFVLDEADLFRFGLVLIFVIAAAGLHVLVNWAGQLSLAHAAMIGLPAFAVAKISFDQGISPIVLIPLGIAVGAGLGSLVALPALRVRGFAVAVITLAAGLSIESFFFTRRWLVGPGAVSISAPDFVVTFRTTASLYVVLGFVFMAVVVALAVLFRSKVARALFWIKSDPDAAAVAGVNVGAYTVLAYAIAGALAGLAGAMTSIWVQRISPENFAFSLAFAYLINVVLAGPGSLVGLLVVVFVLQGLPLFNEAAGSVVGYAGPIAVLVILTRYPAGVNGLIRSARVFVTGERRRLDRERPVVVREAVFPIADYDVLAARDVLPLLDELHPHEVEVVRRREVETRKRSAVLRRLAEMDTDAPSERVAAGARA